MIIPALTILHEPLAADPGIDLDEESEGEEGLALVPSPAAAAEPSGSDGGSEDDDAAGSEEGEAGADGIFES